MESVKELAVFGGGCFWCTEAAFQELRGVINVSSGYAGGSTSSQQIEKEPSYEEVSTGLTGYAEVVKIEFDPAVISYEDLLTVFFAIHDPTTLNRQGDDVGSQYRSIILYYNNRQRDVAEKFIKKLDEGSDKKTVTEVRPIKNFYPAEGYHHNYYRLNPDKPYCQLVISPKLDKLKERFSELLKESQK